MHSLPIVLRLDRLSSSAQILLHTNLAVSRPSSSFGETFSVPI